MRIDMLQEGCVTAGTDQESQTRRAEAHQEMSEPASFSSHRRRQDSTNMQQLLASFHGIHVKHLCVGGNLKAV